MPCALRLYVTDMLQDIGPVGDRCEWTCWAHVSQRDLTVSVCVRAPQLCFNSCVCSCIVYSYINTFVLSQSGLYMYKHTVDVCRITYTTPKHPQIYTTVFGFGNPVNIYNYSLETGPKARLSNLVTVGMSSSNRKPSLTSFLAAAVIWVA